MTNSIVASNFGNSENQSSPFDAIRGYRADGSEYWTARELMKWLGYTRWEKGEIALRRAIKSMDNQGHDSSSQVHQVVKLSNQHNGKVSEIIDFELSRFACYVVAMNADPEKEMVSMAQGYFAMQTRKAEVVIPAQATRIQEMQVEIEMLRLRKEVTILQDTRLALHGLQTTMMLECRPDAIVTIEVPVTTDRYFGNLGIIDEGRCDLIHRTYPLITFVNFRTSNSYDFKYCIN